MKGKGFLTVVKEQDLKNRERGGGKKKDSGLTRAGQKGT